MKKTKRLTEEQVVKIALEYLFTDKSQAEVMRQFDISLPTLQRCVKKYKEKTNSAKDVQSDE